MNSSLRPPLDTSCFKGSCKKTPCSERACAKLKDQPQTSNHRKTRCIQRCLGLQLVNILGILVHHLVAFFPDPGVQLFVGHEVLGIEPIPIGDL